MITRNAIVLLIALALLLGHAPVSLAQEVTGQSSSSTQTDKEKPTPEKRAVALLEQIVGEAAGLKLSENRIYIQISAGDLLWNLDEPRARALFGEAGAAVAEMMRRNDPNDRRSANANRSALELRQQLIITVARHNGELAYQLLQTMPAPPATGPGFRQQDSQTNLEQSLVAAIAANDPKTALKNAQGWLDKGEYPSSLPKVLSQLQAKDADMAAKLSDQLVKKMQPEELLAKPEATRLAMTLLRPGPRPEKKSGDGAQTVAVNSDRFLGEPAFRDVMAAAITAALKATPAPQNATGRGGPGGFRGRPNNAGGAPPTPPTEAEIAQSNARMLLMGLQSLQPQIDQYLPERSLTVRQKITELGMGNDSRGSFGQMTMLIQQGTSDSILTAAASAPQGMQNRLYQQAALKAVDEGKPDRAREIANQHLDGTARDNLLRTVDLRQATRSATPNKMDDIRRTIASAQSDDERVSLLLQFANTLQSDSPKLALTLLDEARGLVSRRAANYGQFEAQLNVAHAFAALDPARSFETLEPGINQINELLSAAALLSGFEVNIFKEGELPLQTGSSLTAMVMRYGYELAALAKIDFEKAQMMTDKFLLPEPRILAKLTLVRGVLGVPSMDTGNNGFGGRGGQFVRRAQ